MGGNVMVPLLSYSLKRVGDAPSIAFHPEAQKVDVRVGSPPWTLTRRATQEGSQSRNLGGDWVLGACATSHKPMSCLHLNSQVREK